MTVKQFSQWLWGFINSIMSIAIPILNYKITLWNIFIFFILIYTIWNFMHDAMGARDENN